MMREKIRWLCPRCKKFVENPTTSSISVIGVTGQRGCNVCGSWLMEIREKVNQ